MAEISMAPHLDDGELLHLVDGDVSNFELDRWTRHVLECDDCSGRLAVLRRRADNFSSRLRDVQLPEGFRLPELPAVRTTRRAWPLQAVVPSSGWLRAAVILAMLAAPLLFVQPLRAWVGGGISAAWEAVVRIFEVGAPDPAPPEGPMGGSARILFEVSGPRLVVDFAWPQPGGALIVSAADGPEASLEVVGGEGESPLLYDDRVQIANRAGSTAGYELRIPSSVEEVIVRVGDAAERRIPVAGIQGEIRVGL